MSSLRIALVAEGPTDLIIIEAALNAFLDTDFSITQLQPEATNPKMGTGWGGVLKWCHAAAKRHTGPAEQDPTLIGYDILILHIDTDVSTMAYTNLGPDVQQLSQNHAWGSLPCCSPCPPPSTSCTALQRVLESWLDRVTIGQHTVLCLPAQASDAWLAAAILPQGHRLLANVECCTAIEQQLRNLPMAQRVKKTIRQYRSHAEKLTSQWAQVKSICSQATIFEHAMLNALP